LAVAAVIETDLAMVVTDTSVAAVAATDFAALDSTMAEAVVASGPALSAAFSSESPWFCKIQTIFRSCRI